ncbi:MAG: type III-A CRISPR-associated RAMP protein Csm3 [Aggregatilineales bacterium]
MNNPSSHRLICNMFIEFEIEVLTGLTIGGSDTGLQIGGVDKVVIRNPFNNEPYIPGSSLRGKIRSSLEKAMGLKLNTEIGKQVRIHSAQTEEDYKESVICQIFGVTGEKAWSHPSRLLVRDIRLSETSRDLMNKRRLDLPYTEVKMEVAIDRITSAANPRSLERVPAGAVFGPGQIVFNVFEGDPIKDYLNVIYYGMLLVEDSYLGGAGSRGSGQIAFRRIIFGKRSISTDNDQFLYGPPTKIHDRVEYLSDFGAALALPELPDKAQ